MRKTEKTRYGNLCHVSKSFKSTMFLFFTFLPFYCFSQLSPEQELKIDSLKQVIASAEQDTVKVSAWIEWANVMKPSNYALRITQYEKAESLCSQKMDRDSLTLGTEEKQFYKKALAYVLLKIGDFYLNLDDYKKSMAYYDRGLKKTRALGNESEIARTQYNIGFIHKKKGDYIKALDCFSESLKIREALGEEAIVAKTLNNLGAIYDNQGDYVKAINHYTRSLKINEKLDRKNGIAHSLNNIGLVYLYQKDYVKSLEYHMRCLEISKGMKDKGKKDEFFGAMMLNNVGLSYKKMREDDKAIDYFSQSLATCEKLENNFGISMVLNNMGVVYSNKGEYSKAIKHLNRSLKIKKETGLNSKIAATYEALGEIYLAQNDFARAKKNGKKALAHAKEIGSLYSTKGANKLLYSIYKKLGNDRLALQMHEAYILARDSVEREKNQREIIHQEFKYNYEKQALADSLQNLEAQKLAEAELTAQKAQNTQQRQQSIFVGIGLLSLLLLSGFTFYRRRNLLQEKLELEQEEAKRLKELDQYKSKLYTNLTHEFRTPLTVILGMAEKLQSEPQKFMNEGPPIIERNGKNLLRIINQLLDLSKLENGSFNLQMRQGEIVSYLRYILESFHSYANGENLSLRFYSNLEKLQMDYDVEQIKQVMTNLISNAIKFTPAGGEVAVRVLRENDQLQIEVKDNGIGIPKEALPLIFDRFYQVDDSSTRAQEGTGIGLAHTKELIKLMDGKITVESNFGDAGSSEKSGSVFTISLPIQNNAPLSENIAAVESAVFVPKPEKMISAASTTASSNKELPTVLIIEDNPDVVIYLKSCLEKSYQLEVAYNGTIGVETAIETVPDLIISDVMMPGKDGFEVCNLLKTDERTSHIPIILLTAKADLSSKLEGLERGADAYLAKPFHQGELDIRLEKLLEGRQKMQHYFFNQYLQSSPENDPSSLGLNSKDTQIEDAFIQKVNTVLEANIADEDFGLIELRRKIGMTRSPFYRKMKALTNTAPSDYIRSYRLRKAKYLLEQTDSNVAEAAYAVGFKNPSYFTKVFQEDYGVAPGYLKH